jgi:ferredoxin
MRVVVDQARCTGHGRCAAVAPDLFALDDETGQCAVSEADVPPGLEEPARLAVDNCPERAISLRA